mgnify:CR=1 FL=1
MKDDKFDDTLDLESSSNEIKEMIAEDDSLKKQLRLLETAYISSQGMEIGTDANDALFPKDWFEDGDFMLKMKIVSDAILENKKIFETEEYQKMSEGKRSVR